MQPTEKGWALVTGASSGIGLELARIFAENDWNLILVARSEARLHQIASTLSKKYGIEAEVRAKDLSRGQAAAELLEASQGFPVTALVNNAGFGSYGPFADSDLQGDLDMLQVNIVALVELTRLFLPSMRERRHGYILNVASTAAFQPGPIVNLYYASKAFVYSFSYALAVELKGSGVSATALCPGLTRTEFFKRARLSMDERFAMDAASVARAGFRGMLNRKRVVIPGVLNNVLSFFAKRMPPALTSPVVRRLHRPRGEVPESVRP